MTARSFPRRPKKHSPPTGGFLVFALLVAAGRPHAAAALEIDAQHFMGVDARGIPVGCRVEQAGARFSGDGTTGPSGLPAGTRGWEAIPGIIRTDGVEWFRLEVDTNGPVTGVRLEGITGMLVPSAPVDLRDDGLGEDQIAGDYVFTAGPFRYNTAVAFPSFYKDDASSPSGLYSTTMGTILITETNASVTQFLLPPSIGFLRADIPAAPVIFNSPPDLAATEHLINVRTEDRNTQRTMRGAGGMENLTTRIYQRLPDVYDFLVFFSTDKVEQLPRFSGPNFYAGLHLHVQTNYTGTGLGLFDASASYGSAGKLLSLNILDAYDRGIVGNNITHEITHQWGCYNSTALNDGTAHYTNWSSVGSLVGGFVWLPNGNGAFIRNCDEGRNGAHYAALLDLYMMGLIAGAGVPPQHISSDPGPVTCDALIPTYTTVTIEDIQALHGPREPGWETSQHDFAIGFVAESHERLLNATERTYYERLAAHYTSEVPVFDPDPYMSFNWPPVTRFFQNNTTWRSNITGTLTGVTVSSPVMLEQNSPNPCRTGTRFGWRGPADDHNVPFAKITIHDLRGGLVRTLAGESESSTLWWDGKNAQGRPVPPGVYLYRVDIGGRSAARKLVVTE